MSTITIQLPETLQDYVKDKVSSGKYQNPEAYVLSLIFQDMQAEERAALEEKLLVGIEQLERGDCKEMTKTDWDRLRSEYWDRINETKTP